MRWSIIRTIWFRETRDQLRDRRTLVMILALPVFLYPLLGFAFMKFASEFTEKPSVIGVVTGSSHARDFPARPAPEAGRSAASALIGAGLLEAAKQPRFDYPCFIENGKVVFFDSEARRKAAETLLKIKFLPQYDPQLFRSHEVDVILEADADFFQKLEAAGVMEPGQIKLLRAEDARGQLAQARVIRLLDLWKLEMKKVRLARMGLSEKAVEPVEVRLPGDARDARRANVDLMVRVFPILLVMWSLAGALYPAVDLCAGEKERGTMETLLITPAGREEIVVGKFLTIWIFSSATAILNLISMGITTLMFAGILPQAMISTPALAWCVVLSLPQSAFFSALALAIGAYARSSKEGQYYLMPLFVVSMPLAFLTMPPGIELNPLYSLIPVTGVALLMQHLMTASTLSAVPWGYFVPVLFPIAVYSWLALRWAIEQFNREDVLFREAERLDVGLWLKSIFRDKEPLPTTGQAFFALAALIGLRWLSTGMGERWTLQTYTIVGELAFVAAPALFMALLLNTQPGAALYLRWPKGRDTGVAAALALLLLPPMLGLTQAVIWYDPGLLQGSHPLISIMRGMREGRDLDSSQLGAFLLAFALVPALCEELAFRGLVLCGLHHGFRPRNAVLLSAFFFALFHLNVFLFLPTFLLGVVAGLLTVRSRSLLPAILFHLLYNSVLIAMIPLTNWSGGAVTRVVQDGWAWLIGICVTLATALVWWLYRKPYVDLARKEAAERAQTQ